MKVYKGLLQKLKINYKVKRGVEEEKQRTNFEQQFKTHFKKQTLKRAEEAKEDRVVNFFVRQI